MSSAVSDMAPTDLEHGVHHLADVEGMSPVVVGHGTVVLLHRHQPATEHRLVDPEPLQQTAVQHHPHTRLPTSDVIVTSLTSWLTTDVCRYTGM